MLRVLRGVFKHLASRSLLAYLLIAGFLFFVFIWQLSTLVPGLSPAEVSARNGSLSLQAIYSNPVNAPFKLLQLIFLKADNYSIFSLRIPSVIFAILFVLCFYKLAVSWFGRAIGLFGTLVFLSLPLFVISARQGSGEIMLFAPIVLMWLYVLLIKPPGAKQSAWLMILIASAFLAYTPGLLLWILGAAIICRKRLVSIIAGVPRWNSGIGCLAAIIIISPLVLSSISRPETVKELLLVPNHLPAVTQALKNIGWMFLAIFVETPTNTPLIIERLPLLNVLLLAVMIFGIYAMQAAARLKTYALALSVFFAATAAGINNNLVLLAIGLPALAIFICAGLRYLYIEWRVIFPRNPVPKTFALLLIGGVVASQLFFGLRYSLVAWPNTTATKSVYVLK